MPYKLYQINGTVNLVNEFVVRDSHNKLIGRYAPDSRLYIKRINETTLDTGAKAYTYTLSNLKDGTTGPDIEVSDEAFR